MKKIFLTTIVVFSFIAANSQESKFSVGLKVEMNLSNVDMEYLDTDVRIGY